MSESKSFQVTFTEQSATRLLQLLNIAVQAQGLAVAQDALVFTNMVQTAFKASQDAPLVPVTEKHSTAAVEIPA